MIAKDIVTQERTPLTLSTTGTEALLSMADLKVSGLPIVDGEEYIGIISDAEIEELKIGKKKLTNYTENLIRPFVLETEHLYEVIKMLANFRLRTLPVLNEKHKYIGSITLMNVVEKLSWLSAAREPGGIILLEIDRNDYSLAKIAQIIEGNDGKVLSCHLSSSKKENKIDVTLKVNKDDLSGILQTFERYNYTVLASFNRTDHKNDIMSKYDELMNYLNI
jgi:acetoin utilization protein AcuB